MVYGKKDQLWCIKVYTTMSDNWQSVIKYCNIRNCFMKVQQAILRECLFSRQNIERKASFIICIYYCCSENQTINSEESNCVP